MVIYSNYAPNACGLLNVIKKLIRHKLPFEFMSAMGSLYETLWHMRKWLELIQRRNRVN